MSISGSAGGSSFQPNSVRGEREVNHPTRGFDTRKPLKPRRRSSGNENTRLPELPYQDATNVEALTGDETDKSLGLAKRVLKAYANRKREEFDEKGTSTLESLRTLESAKQKIEAVIATGVDLSELIYAQEQQDLLPHQVVVDTLEDFQKALIVTYIVLAYEADVALPSDVIVQRVEEIMKHEQGHKSVFESTPGTNSQYRLNFYSDAKTGQSRFNAEVHWWGKMPLTTLLEAYRNVSDPSPTDSIISSINTNR